MANENISEQRPAAPETPPIGDHDADIRATLDTLDKALLCAIGALPGLSSPLSLPHNLHVAVRAASDVRGLLEMGGETEDYDPTNVRAAVGALTRQAVDMQHEIGVLRSEFGLNGSVARKRSAGYPAQAAPEDAGLCRSAEQNSETVDDSSGPEDGALVLDEYDRRNIRDLHTGCERALRALLSDIGNQTGDALGHLQRLANGLDAIGGELRLDEVQS